MSDTNAAFAAWLRSARTDAGMSQQQVADALSSAGHRSWQQQVDMIERGSRGVRLHEAVALAALFGTTVDGALGGAVPRTATAATAARRAALLIKVRELVDAELGGAS